MRTFDSLGGFAKHLKITAAMGEAVTHFAAKSAAKVVADDAKARIGEYQDGVGPFAAWANLAESTVDDRLAKGYTPDDPLLRSGELRDSIVVVADGDTAGAVSAEMIALWQEQGTNRIPPRAFLGPAAFTAEPKITAELSAIMVRWIAGSPMGKMGRPLPE